MQFAYTLRTVVQKFRSNRFWTVDFTRDLAKVWPRAAASCNQLLAPCRESLPIESAELNRWVSGIIPTKMYPNLEKGWKRCSPSWLALKHGANPKDLCYTNCTFWYFLGPSNNVINDGCSWMFNMFLWRINWLYLVRMPCHVCLNADFLGLGYLRSWTAAVEFSFCWIKLLIVIGTCSDQIQIQKTSTITVVHHSTSVSDLQHPGPKLIFIVSYVLKSSILNEPGHKMPFNSSNQGSSQGQTPASKPRPLGQAETVAANLSNEQPLASIWTCRCSQKKQPARMLFSASRVQRPCGRSAACFRILMDLKSWRQIGQWVRWVLEHHDMGLASFHGSEIACPRQTKRSFLECLFGHHP